MGRKSWLFASLLLVLLLAPFPVSGAAGTQGARSRDGILSPNLGQKPSLFLQGSRPIKVRLEGLISEMTPGPGPSEQTWIVGGFAVRVGEGTPILPEGYPVAVGDWATVTAIYDLSGVLLAQRIRIHVGAIVAIPFEFSGAIEALETGSGGMEMLVGGMRVVITGETELLGEPTVGYVAFVRGELLPSNVVRAGRVESLSPEAAELRVELEGLIEAILDGTLVVDGRIVYFGADTEIQGELLVGYTAEVAGDMQPDGSVWARRINAYAPPAPGASFCGIIQDIQPDWWLVDGTKVWIGNAEMPRQGHEGFAAQVSGLRRKDGSVEATTILVEEIDPATQVHISGLVEQLATDNWVIRAGAQKLTIHLDPYTFIDEGRAPAEKGNEARISAVLRRDGSLLALRIRLERPG